MENAMFQDPEKAEYRWIITKDHLAPRAKPEFKDDLNVCCHCGDVLTSSQVSEQRCNEHRSEAGVEGPRNLDDTLKTNPATFSLYDDDDICYYEGMLYGEYEGFEPLDDYGMPNAGCTYMKLDGEVL
jgi:hypothetical protein